MYPQYPQYPYPYSPATPSGGYNLVPAYAPEQQAYYPPQYFSQAAVSAAAGAPFIRRLPIRDPSTGLVVPVVASDLVEQAVKNYHLHSKVRPGLP